MNTQDQGFNSLANALHKQLRGCGISTKYELEYRRIIAIVMRYFDVRMEFKSIDDSLFEQLREYKEPSRSKAIWVFSLLDDFMAGRESEVCALPIRCQCGEYMNYNNEISVYACNKCHFEIKASSEDAWLRK